MKFSTTIATTMLMAVHCQAFDVEEEITSLWNLPFDKITPEPEFPEQSDTEPEPQPEPEDPEPVDPEPVDPEPVDPEPVDPEPVDPEPVDPEPVDPEPVDPEPVDPEPVDPEPVDPEPVDPEPEEPIDKYPDEQRDIAVSTFDGHCVGCIAAGYIFCMDGNNNSSHTVQEFGSCQPTVAHCTNDNHVDWNFQWRSEFAMCDYQGVKDPATGQQYPLDQKVLDLDVTPSEATTLLDVQDFIQLPVLLDIYLAPDSYQFIHVTNSAGENVDELELGFQGGIDEQYNLTAELMPRKLSGADLNLLQIYYSEVQPTYDWESGGHWSQLLAGQTLPFNSLGNGTDLWLILANTATTGYQMQMLLTMNEVEVPEEEGASSLGLAMAAALVLLEMF